MCSLLKLRWNCWPLICSQLTSSNEVLNHIVYTEYTWQISITLPLPMKPSCTTPKDPSPSCRPSSTSSAEKVLQTCDKQSYSNIGHNNIMPCPHATPRHASDSVIIYLQIITLPISLHTIHHIQAFMLFSISSYTWKNRLPIPLSFITDPTLTFPSAPPRLGCLTEKDWQLLATGQAVKDQMVGLE